MQKERALSGYKVITRTRLRDGLDAGTTDCELSATKTAQLINLISVLQAPAGKVDTPTNKGGIQGVKGNQARIKRRHQK